MLLQAGDINIAYLTILKLFQSLNVTVRGRMSMVRLVCGPRPARLSPVSKRRESRGFMGHGRHKWLNVPFDCGYAFISHADAHGLRCPIAHRISHIMKTGATKRIGTLNGRGARVAFPRMRRCGNWAATVLQSGRSPLPARDKIVTGIGRLAALKLLWEPTINQGLVRFLDPLRRHGTGP